MRFLADANIYVPMVEKLRELGNSVLDLKEEGLENLSDPEVYTLAQKNECSLITMDKDFSNIISYPPGTHFGIIVIKLYRMKVIDATKIFLNAIKSLKPNDIHGNIVIIDKNKVRVRKERISS